MYVHIVCKFILRGASSAPRFQVIIKYFFYVGRGIVIYFLYLWTNQFLLKICQYNCSRPNGKTGLGFAIEAKLQKFYSFKVLSQNQHPEEFG